MAMLDAPSLRGSSAPEIPRRRIDLDLDPRDVPLDFYADDAFLSTLMGALSLVFPEGERFFVASVRRYRDRITDEALLADIRGFIGQEAMHAKEHEAFNAVLRAQGLDGAEALEGEVRALLDHLRRNAPPRARLAVTCALEHFTAMLAEQLLTDAAHREAIHPSVRPLWLWHALEESEHKAVAYDVYQAVGGTYPRRVGVMLTTTLIFFWEIMSIHLRLLAARGELTNVRGFARGVSYLWGRRGLFRGLIPAYLDYFRPSFHPNDRDTSRLVAAWREELFGAEGTMRQHWK